MAGKENRGPQVEGVAILFLVLTWCFVGMRCYVRAIMINGFGWDDWLAVASLVCFFPYSINYIQSNTAAVVRSCTPEGAISF